MRDNGHLDFVNKADRCDNFFRGFQWEEADLNRLRAERRPALTINKIISTMSTVMGEQIYNRMEVAFRPKSGAPAQMADVWNKVWASIASSNQLNWLRSDVFADGIIRSRGFYDVRLDFSDSMAGEVDIKKVSSKNVVIDPDADDYDPDTWNDVITTKWMTPVDISVLYDEAAGKELENRPVSEFMYGFDSIERKRDRVAGPTTVAGYYDVEQKRQMRHIRVLDRQYVEHKKVLFFVDRLTGDMREIPAAWDRNRVAAVAAKYDLAVLPKLTKKIRWCVTADTIVLHNDWSPYKHFTVVPYFPYFRDGYSIGLVENLLGPQELLNKSSSQELHVINTTANSGWKVKTGSLTNMTIQDLESTGAVTGLVMELDDVNNAEKILPNQIPQGLDRLTFKAEEHIKSISNVSDSMQGFDREDVAARAIQAKQARSSVNFTKISDNLERTDYFLARSVMDIVQEFYTEPRILRITHDDLLAEPEEIQINQVVEDGSILNDLTQGEFDIVVTSAPYRATLEDSQFEQALALREAGVQIPDDVLIENSRLMRKNELAKRIEAAKTDPQAQAKAALQMRAFEAEVVAKEAEAAQKKADADLKVSQTAKTLSEVGTDTAAQEMSVEMFKAREEAALQKWKVEKEMELKEHESKLRLRLQEDEALHKRRLAEDESRAKAMAIRTSAAMGGGQAAPSSASPQH
jgi:hypothetical protein